MGKFFFVGNARLTWTDLFDKPSRLQILTPTAVLGAASELDDRYRGLDAGVRDPLLADMRAEDAALKTYIESCRLGKWFEGALDLARRSVEEEKKAEEEGKRGLKEVAERLREIEGEIEERERAVAREMLRSKPRVRGRERRVGA